MFSFKAFVLPSVMHVEILTDKEIRETKRIQNTKCNGVKFDVGFRRPGKRIQKLDILRPFIYMIEDAYGYEIKLNMTIGGVW